MHAPLDTGTAGHHSQGYRRKRMDVSRVINETQRAVLSQEREIRYAGRAEHPAVALDLGSGPQRLSIIVRELHGRAAFYLRYFADQADWIKTVAIIRIASSEVIGQQCSPAGAEPDLAVRRPLAAVVEGCGVAKILRLQALRHVACEI